MSLKSIYAVACDRIAFFKAAQYSMVYTQDFFFFLVFYVFKAANTSYEGSQAKGQIGATAVGLHHTQSNAGSEPRL